MILQEQLRKVARFFSCDIGIDLGTANFLVFMKGRGIVISEPSVVAIKNGRVWKVGREAKRMLGRVPAEVKACRPMKYGVIADPQMAESMLHYFITKAKEMIPPRKRLYKPRVLIAVPSGITQVERMAVKESAENAGASSTLLIEEPMAAAIGAGLPVMDPGGCMIVDIGGGTTEVAVISLSGIVEQRSVRVGGDEMDQAIIQHMKKVYNLMIGEPTAEIIKIEMGSAYAVEEEKTMEIKGRDVVSGLPKAIEVSSKEIRAALSNPVTDILGAVRSTLESCPPELACDVMNRGIMLSGGGSLLKGLDKLISEEMNIPVTICKDPLNAVANGTGFLLEDLDMIDDE